VNQGEAIGTRMKENGGAERPGHVAGEGERLERGRTARSSAMPPYPCSTVAKEVTSRYRTSRQSSGRVGLAGGAVKRGGAHRGDDGAKWKALSEGRSCLRLPLGVW